MIKDKKLKETDDFKSQLRDEEIVYTKLEAIVRSAIERKKPVKDIIHMVFVELYYLKDLLARTPGRDERLDIAVDFVDALLPDGYMKESLKESSQKTIYSWYKRTYPDDYQVEDIVKDVTFEQAKEVMDEGKSLNSLLGKNLDTHVIDRIYDEVKKRFTESLKEDIDTVVPEKDDTTVLSASTLPVANKLIEAINGEWDTIVLYNNIITELKENNFDDIIPVIQDIVKEENTHVGQLQKALSTISPDTDDIASGEVEAEGQLNESLEECDDCEYFDDIDSEDEFELYRTDSREILSDKDQKRIRDRRLVDRDREPIRRPAREDLFDDGERVYEKEIRKALEDGSITKEDIVEYTLKNTPDEMLSGMLNMSSDEIDLYDNGYDSVTDTLYRGDDCYDDLTDVEVNCCMDDIYMKPADTELDICDADLEMGDNLPEECEDKKKLQEFGPVAAAVVSAVAPVVADRVMDKILPEEAKEEPADLKKVIPEADDEPASMEDDLDENAVNMI